MLTRSPSAFVRESIGLSRASSQQSAQHTQCALCAADLPAGDDCSPLDITTYNKTFADHAYIGDRSSRHICPDCLPLWDSLYLQQYSKSFVTPQGLFKLSSASEQASFLLTPPDEPFMAFISTTKQQHLIWRTPINRQAQRFTLRLGVQLVTIRHPLLMSAVDAHADLLAVTAEASKTGDRKEKFSLSSVFQSPDLQMLSLGYPLHPAVLEANMDNAALPAITALSAGERWALYLIIRSGLTRDTVLPPTRLLPSDPNAPPDAHPTTTQGE